MMFFYRFKQIKEQEARKKQQKEEELRKLAAKAGETTNKEPETHKNEIEESDAKPADVRSERDQYVNDTHVFCNGVTDVNSEHSLQSIEDNQKSLSLPGKEKGVVGTTGADEKEDLLLHGKLEKVHNTFYKLGLIAVSLFFGEEIPFEAVLSSS